MCGALLILDFDVKSYRSLPLLAWKCDTIAGCIFLLDIGVCSIGFIRESLLTASKYWCMRRLPSGDSVRTGYRFRAR